MKNSAVIDSRSGDNKHGEGVYVYDDGSYTVCVEDVNMYEQWC